MKQLYETFSKPMIDIVDKLSKSWSRTIPKTTHDKDDLHQEGLLLLFEKDFKEENHFSSSLRNHYSNVNTYSKYRDHLTITTENVKVEIDINPEEFFMLKVTSFLAYLKDLAEPELLLVCTTALTSKLPEPNLTNLRKKLNITSSQMSSRLRKIRHHYKQFQKLEEVA